MPHNRFEERRRALYDSYYSYMNGGVDKDKVLQKIERLVYTVWANNYA